MRGGYQIVDLGGINYQAGQSKTVPGVYDKIEGNYYKPILLTNMVQFGHRIGDVFVRFKSSGSIGSYIWTDKQYNLSVIITSSDTVNIVAASSTQSIESETQSEELL